MAMPLCLAKASINHSSGDLTWSECAHRMWLASDRGSAFTSCPGIDICIYNARADSCTSQSRAYMCRHLILKANPGMQTDAFYDATGSATAVAVILSCLNRIEPTSDAAQSSILALVLVGMWTTRLGLLLAYRIHRLGHDSRMDKMKKQPATFVIAWTMQGVWIFIITLPAQVLSVSDARVDVAGLRLLVSAAGLLLWATGFTLESVADWQKLCFRLNPANKVSHARPRGSNGSHITRLAQSTRTRSRPRASKLSMPKWIRLCLLERPPSSRRRHRLFIDYVSLPTYVHTRQAR